MKTPKTKIVNRVLALLGIGLMVAGGVTLANAYSYPRFTDEAEFEHKYMAIRATSVTAGKQFYALRDEYLTPRFDLEDYGFTLILAGGIVCLVALIGLNRLRTPRKNYWVVVTGVAAALTYVAGYFGDIILDYKRGEFPHWADAIAIPLFGALVAFLPFLLVWVGLNSLGLRWCAKTGVPFSSFRLHKVNFWYALCFVLTFLMTAQVLLTGGFWYVIPQFLWLYFYASLLLARRQMKAEERPEIVALIDKLSK